MNKEKQFNINCHEDIPEDPSSLQQQQGCPSCDALQTVLEPVNSNNPSKPAHMFKKMFTTIGDKAMHII